MSEKSTGEGPAKPDAREPVPSAGGPRATAADLAAYATKRAQLVAFLASRGSLSHPLLRRAFLAVPREAFVPVALKSQAYADGPLPIGFGQTISQPSTIAAMLEFLELRENQNVLEVGSGCGYVLALLAETVGNKGRVTGIEFVKELADNARKNLDALGYKNVNLIHGDGSKGLPDKAPFDRILLSCAAPFFPKPLFDQLAENGIGVAPVGDPFSQEMLRIKKVRGHILKETLPGSLYAFVPLRGEHGFR